MRTRSSRRAYAGVAGNAVDAGSAVRAWITGTLVDVDAAVGSGEAWGALASEPVDAVDAATAVQAGQWLTVVHVPAAVGALEALAADAAVAAVGGVDAGRAVLAGIGGAGGRGDVAGGALPARWTVAGEAVAAVLASAAMATGTGLAVTAAQRARLALPAVAADTREVRHAVDAGPVVTTGIVQAFIHI